MQMMGAMNPQLYGQQQPVTNASGEPLAGPMMNGQMMQQDGNIAAAPNDGGLNNMPAPPDDDRPSGIAQENQEMDQNQQKED